jgi:hypothetical protein
VGALVRDRLEMADKEGQTGLVLWGGVELDVSLPQLQQHRCSRCRKPATYASRDLEKQERVFLCARCASGRVSGKGVGRPRHKAARG